ncbi:MAG: hypothetical protein ACXABY_25485, partial [Candidatus Thorarchaeota archaeon]
GFVGGDIPEMMKQRIESATGKKLKYHRPDKSWIYDSELDGGMEAGDPRMAAIAKAIMSKDIKSL